MKFYCVKADGGSMVTNGGSPFIFIDKVVQILGEDLEDVQITDSKEMALEAIRIMQKAFPSSTYTLMEIDA